MASRTLATSALREEHWNVRLELAGTWILANADAAVIAAWIGAGVALLVALISGLVSVWSSSRQRAVNLVVAALSHMEGGSQERSAGIAALRAMRGPLERRPRRFNSNGWVLYGPSVGQQLYRQLIYVLVHGDRKYFAHEAENIIAMMEWLLTDESLQFDDRGERNRLARAVEAYGEGLPAPDATATSKAAAGSDPTLKELQGRISQWVVDLGRSDRA